MKNLQVKVDEDDLEDLATQYEEALTKLKETIVQEKKSKHATKH